MRHHFSIGSLFLVSVLMLPVLVMAEGRSVFYKVGNEGYEGYFASAGGNAPLVLLIHDWDGLTQYERQRADMLAELGYSVFAVDLFGVSVRPTEDKDKRQHTGALYKDRKKMRALLRAGLTEARKRGVNIRNAVAMGYCFGGSAVLELARSGEPLKGFVTFHGGLATPSGQDYAHAQGKLLIMHGAADVAITMADFAQLAQELEQHKVEHEMIAYGGAPHAFTVFGSQRYREDADRKSWQRFIQFLEEVTR